MLDTYGMDDINTQAIRELTTEVDGAKRKIAKLENLTGLPDIANADRGKTLKVKSNKNEAHWVAVPEVPTPAVADAGKVLGVNDEGKYAIVEGGGGSSIPNFRIQRYTPTGQDARLKIANWTELTTLAQVKELFENPYFVSDDWRYSMANVYYGSRFVYQWNVNMIAIAQAVSTEIQITLTNMAYCLDDGTIIRFTSDDATRPLIIATCLTIINNNNTPTFSIDEYIFDAVTGREIYVYDPIT